MSAVQNLSRRQVLGGLVGAGALVLGVRGARAAALLGGGAAEAFEPSVWLAIEPSGIVTIVAHRSEMGTGIKTSLPLVLADELGAEWDQVRVVQAEGHPRYGDQNTDGSRSIRQYFHVMRVAGATARRMLEEAAAFEWGVPREECRARDHAVEHGPSGRRLAFGDLVARAREGEVPLEDEIELRPRSELRWVGKETPRRVDTTGILTGRAGFGIDVRVEGLRFAAIARPPVLGGMAKAFDREAALAVPGVVAVHELAPFTPPHAFQPLGGVAVLATSTWAALQGRDALAVEWEDGPHASYDSDAYEEQLLATAREPGRLIRDEGDARAELDAAERRIEADYFVPHLAHASMEPPCATARWEDGKLEVWAPTQDPQTARGTLAQLLEVPAEDVTVHVTLLGGGFGRKSKPDFAVEAAKLARAEGAPVQVVWTREDDLRHDYLHAVAAVHCEAALGADGQPTAWLQRSVFPPIGSTFQEGARQGSDLELGLGFTTVPYAVPNLRCENGEAGAHVRIGWFRSVAHVYHAFAVCSFPDELAHAAGRDPLEYLLALLGPDRELELSLADGVSYPNHGEPLERYPIDTARLRRVLERAAQESGWGEELPRGRGRGVAVHRSFLSYVAHVVEVDVSRDGQVRIPRVDVAADCGTLVDPDRVRAQFEGGAVFAASLALTGEITARRGRVVQSNFHDYPIARMHDAPRDVRVHLVESDAPPAGVGEPPVPTFAPALCNAIFAATGKRVRRLPLARHDLSWS